MTVPVITASAGSPWEAALATAANGDREASVQIVRRCVDLVDLLAVAALGSARCVLVDARLPGLDRSAVAVLAEHGVSIVGITADHVGEEQLRGLGIRTVARHDDGYSTILTAIGIALDGSAAADAGESSSITDVQPGGSRGGRVIAVWGAHGAPGRSTVAMSIADECAARGLATLLIDADTYGGSIGQMLGILDEAPGIVAATRLANEGRLDAGGLRECTRLVSSGLMVLTGIAKPQRWTELKPEAFIDVLDVARRIAAVIVVDLASCVEQDEELFFDTMAPRRNGLTITTLALADQVLMVASADPVGLQRAVRLMLAMPDELPGVHAEVVVNRLRKAALPGGSKRDQVVQTFTRHLGRAPIAVIASDRPACDKGLAAGRTLREVAAGSSARTGLRDLARRLVPEADRRLLRRQKPAALRST